MQSLELVYRYRSLLGKCETGVGLEFDEIDTLTQIEAAFAPGPREPRRFKRLGTDLRAMLRGGDLNDRVTISELAPGGFVVRQAPYVDEGMIIEIAIDDPDAAVSYRFKAKVQWLKDDLGDDFALGLELVGVPVMIHYGAPAERPSELDQIAA